MENFSIFASNQATSSAASNLPISELVNQSSNSNPIGVQLPPHQHHDILSIFKLSETSLQVWKSKYQNRPISYKLCIIDFKRKDSELEARHQEEVSSNIAEYVNNNLKVEIAVLNEDECKFKNQETFGHIYDANEYVFLKASIDDMSKWVSATVVLMTMKRL